MRRLLITSALPYANGHIHIGHLVEYTQTDIFARYWRMTGRRCIYLCADDTHGTAIMIRARQEGRSEAEVIADMSAAHQRDFAAFQIRFDHYGSTNSPANRALCEEFWASLRERGMVTTKDVTQLFDPKEGMFLADRFVKGTCPKCAAPDQYGDSCDKCGATYAATDLVEPRSALTGARPEVRSAQHLMVAIEPERPFLSTWTQGEGRMPKEIANYLAGHFLSEPLRDWDVSRPAPYFGFEIPDAPGNYWYVWFDAPIGYMAASKEWCDREGEVFDDWWRSEETEIVHVIGKDIVYFHTLFWPAMLKSARFTLPSRVQVHGFLTVNGEKMSKSKGTFVLASTYLKHLDPSYLRYYYASKLSSKVDDIDLNLEELVNKVNAELVNKVVNLASRSSRFVAQTGLSAAYPEDGGLFAAAAGEAEAIGAAYAGFDYARATRIIVSLADRANEYVDRMQPWALAKQPDRKAEVQAVCTVALNLFRQIVIYLAPVLPKLADDVARLLGCPMDRWELAKTPLVGTKVAAYEHLMKRVDPAAVEKMIVESRPVEETAAGTGGAAAGAAAPAAIAGAAAAQGPAASGGAAPAVEDDGAALAKEPLAAECSIDDFTKVDLRVARIVAAEQVPEAKKLLKLTVSLGGDVRRTVFAGIKAYYKPEDLVGRLVIVCANLAPRKMKFGVSEGMVLAAGDETVHLLSPDSGAKPGMRVH
ncbi:methionyl-tRNA synthetase [Sorangium cellulosum]|uniref:Methionine--tRNA ligase n=1 Tax=Sorangium cellulosum TaxID=56 RepID=A0A2L0F8F9_SORCE|nr:methionine--tRNA ligase [Sorangium cellulosum]AUX47802.1 methionyl-tRNA synthetase [Sorangium cellulosum]